MARAGLSSSLSPLRWPSPPATGFAPGLRRNNQTAGGRRPYGAEDGPRVPAPSFGLLSRLPIRPTTRSNQPANTKSKNVWHRFYKIVANDTTAIIGTTTNPPPAIIVYDDFPSTIQTKTTTTAAAARMPGTSPIGWLKNRNAWAKTWLSKSGRPQQRQPPPVRKRPSPPPTPSYYKNNHLRPLSPPPKMSFRSPTARWLLIVSAALYGTNFAVSIGVSTLILLCCHRVANNQRRRARGHGINQTINIFAFAKRSQSTRRDAIGNAFAAQNGDYIGLRNSR
jgi:hypothetical protein